MVGPGTSIMYPCSSLGPGLYYWIWHAFFQYYQFILKIINFFFLQRLRTLLKPTWDWGPGLNVDRVAHGYKPFRGRGGPVPSDYAGPYASRSDGAMKYEPSNGVSFYGAEGASEATSNGTPPPAYTSINT